MRTSRLSEFQRDLASLSHDIRTPPMGAKGYLRLAQDEGDEVGRARRLAAAEARLDDMGALLDQLFAYAQANDPDLALDLAPVAVLPALADVLVGQFPAFERRGWEPRVDFEDEALSVDADAEALARIFENLGERAAPRLGAACGGAARSLRDVRERGARPRRPRSRAPVRALLPR